MVQTLPTRCFTADEYDRMIAAGILCEGEQVELIEGRIVSMAALGSQHTGCVIQLTVEFNPLVASHRAAAGIPEAWLAVVGSRRRLEVFRKPEGGIYRDHQVLNRDASIAPLAFPTLVIAVRAILG